MKMQTDRNRRDGSSLLEVVVATLLVGVVLVAALDAVGGALRSSRFGSQQIDRRTVALGLMAEVLAAPYEDPDAAAPEFGIESDEPQNPTNRSQFDDLDDYRGWSSTSTRQDGAAISAAAGWTSEVIIEKLSNSPPIITLDDATADQGVRRVTVSVTDADGQTTSLESIRSKMGTVEQQLFKSSDVVTGIMIELDAGGAPVLLQSTHLVNHAQGP